MKLSMLLVTLAVLFGIGYGSQQLQGQCPGNQIFSNCSSCLTTCAERHRPKVCTLECRVGCTCPPNTYLNGTNCVIAHQCPELQVRQCPPLVSPDTEASFEYECSNGRKVGSLCRLSCSGSGRMLFGEASRVFCLPRGEWSRDVSKSRCAYDNRCPLNKLPPFGVSESCPSCPDRGCPFTKGQICCPTGCGVTCIDIPQSCPGNTKPSFCLREPCDIRTCEGHPNATCTNNYCGNCHAIFTDPETNVVIPQFACHRRVNWPGCLASLSCPNNKEECRVGCAGVSNARCVQDCNCRTIFVDARTGRTLTHGECNPVSTCPRLQPRGVRVRCTRGRYVGSVCSVSCNNGALKGVSQTTCTGTGRWTADLKDAKCVLDDRCPVVEQIPSASGHLCPSCAQCLKGQICCKAPICGYMCVTIPPQSCPVLPLGQNGLEFRCNNGSNIGSVCRAICPRGTIVDGKRRFSCNKPGRWSTNANRINCIPNPRCPAVRNGTVGICPVCPRRCPRGRICCRTGCGTTCVRPVRQCPALRLRRVSFEISCTAGNNVGSRCDITCPEGKFLRGITQIQCLPSGKWNQEFDNTQCIPNQDCPANNPAVSCKVAPCKVSACPGSPNAACVDNYCGGCNFKHFLNGREVHKILCIPGGFRSCGITPPSRPCKKSCRRAVCRGRPNAIFCRENRCDCTVKFYDQNTFEEVECENED